MGSRARLRTSVLNIRKYYLEGEKIRKLIRSTCKPTSFKPYLQTHSWTWKMDFRSQASVPGAGWGGEKRRGLLRDRGRLLPQARAFLLPGGLRADGRWWAHGASRTPKAPALQGWDADREAWRQRSRSSNRRKRPSPPRAEVTDAACSFSPADSGELQKEQRDLWLALARELARQQLRQAPGLQRQSPALKDRELKKNDLGSLSPQTRLPVNR